jgi:hypothetical protein
MAAAAIVLQPSDKACDFLLWWLTKSGVAMVVASRCKQVFKQKNKYK